MKIGIVVDGDAESQALKLLTRRITISRCQIIDPIFARMQPKSTPDQIVRMARGKVDILLAKGVDQILVLIDREDNKECPGIFADRIKNAFARAGYGGVSVVVKDRCFENWLVADVDALEQLRRRFQVTTAFKNSIVPNKADNINAFEQLNRITRGPSYHKRRDAAAITEKQDPVRVALNSRSFRRFLKLISHPNYRCQSKYPSC